jgi:glutamyl-tRNA synthetase
VSKKHRNGPVEHISSPSAESQLQSQSQSHQNPETSAERLTNPPHQRLDFSKPVVRFAPSPTGYLHIGGARTALFNWLFAKHHGGKFLLRIEDTDRERSTDVAINAIFESLQWLELKWDEEPVFQFARATRHAEIAQNLVKEGKAYYCYCSPEELEQMRSDAMAHGLPPRYNRYWRDRDPSCAPAGVAPVIRFKAPLAGKTTILDLVQGEVELSNTQLDDMILLRADGTPTYMLSVVVDDYDMHITHIIRGDDHLTNAFRQHHLYEACGWETPRFAHIPLIHGPDGAKLSKRHGALGAEQYKEMGFLPEAMRNYLLRLGWAHGNDEIISTEQAIEWFDLSAIGRSPARFDTMKLINLNGHYIRASDNNRLLEEIRPRITKTLSEAVPDQLGGGGQAERGLALVLRGMDSLKERAKTLEELAKSAIFYVLAPTYSASDNIHATPEESIKNLDFCIQIIDGLHDCGQISQNSIETAVRGFCKDNGLKIGDFLYPVRVALTGKKISPSLFEVIEILGLKEVVARLHNYKNFLSCA